MMKKIIAPMENLIRKTVLFFQRTKFPKHPVLDSLVLFEKSFNCLMNCCYYSLCLKTPSRTVPTQKLSVSVRSFRTCCIHSRTVIIFRRTHDNILFLCSARQGSQTLDNGDGQLILL